VKNLGLAFLALAAFFLGGLSIFFIGISLYEISLDSYDMNSFGGAILILATPILAVAAPLAWWAWRARKRLWEKIDYVILALLPFCVAVWAPIVFVNTVAFELQYYREAFFADFWKFAIVELSRYIILGVASCCILWSIRRAYIVSIGPKGDRQAISKSKSVSFEKSSGQPPEDKP
jgi:hypothetical protein